MGLLSWPPSEFWKSTPHDVCAAVAGYCKGQGDTSERDAEENSALFDLWEEMKAEDEAKKAG